jgi:hypothetical protein
LKDKGLFEPNKRAHSPWLATGRVQWTSLPLPHGKREVNPELPYL